MPVVSLPADNRWGSLGQGLGGVLGQVAGALAQKQTAAGVAEIMQDPSISDSDKGVQALKKYGDSGYKVYQDLVRTQVLQGQLKNQLAQAGLAGVETAAKQLTLPTVAPQAEANVAKTKMGTAVDQARIPVLQSEAASTAAEVPVKQATAAEANARVPLIGSQTEKTNVETSVAKLQYESMQRALDQTAAMGGNVAGSLDTTIKAVGIDPNSPTAQLAKAAYANEPDPLKKSAAFLGVLKTNVNATNAARIRADAPKQTPEPQIKLAGTSIEEATSAERFADDFLKGGAQQLGAIKGANIKALAERYGFPTGDTSLVDMWNASYQQVASAATGGGGFFAQGRVKLAQDVTPGITETPLHAALSLDQVADRQLARLQTERSGLAPQQSKEPLDQAIAKWQAVKSKLDLHSDILTDPVTKKPRTVLYVGGSQVDPKTFDKLVNAQQTYKFKGTSFTGAQIIADAQRRGIAPDARLAEIKAYLER